MLYEITKIRHTETETEFEYVGWHSLAEKRRMTSREYSLRPGDVSSDNVVGKFANNHRVTGLASDADCRRIAQDWLEREWKRFERKRQDVNGRDYASRDARGTTLNLTVSQSDDNGWFDLPGSKYQSCVFGFSSGSFYSYFGVDASIAEGSVIEDAIVSFWPTSAIISSGSQNRLRLVNEGSPTNPVLRTDWTNLTKTSAYFDWWVSDHAPQYVGTATDYRQLADVTTMLQSVVDSQSITRIMATIEGGLNLSGGAVGYLVTHSYDSDASKAPKFDIDYTEPTSGGLLMRRRRQ